LKSSSRLRLSTNRNVSNPWREAIEVQADMKNLVVFLTFPILGGRLLKLSVGGAINTDRSVSNPWREAIEASLHPAVQSLPKVSNPWREAIEAG